MVAGKFSLHSARTRQRLAILGLAIVFYLLASITIERMPFTSHPSWWMSIWPSPRVGEYTWFGLLNAAGAIIAAVPVALLLRRLIGRDCLRAAISVGVITALVVIGSVAAKYSPFGHARAIMTLELVLVMFLAVPFMVWVTRALPYRKPVERS